METVEGAAAGYYVAALFESGRPDHRGVNAARLVRDARAASRSVVARARLRLARLTFPVYGPRTVWATYVEYGTTRIRPRPRGAGRVRGRKSRRAGAA